MTPPFLVRSTPRFARLARALSKHHPDLDRVLDRVIEILQVDPHNRTRSHNIRKLEGVPPGAGQYRLRLGRWRFRYDIVWHDALRQEVVLHYCGLRREDTYDR